MIRSNHRRFPALQREALDLLMRVTSGCATVTELHRLEAWRERSPAHAEAYRQALGVWDALGTAAGDIATVQDRLLGAERQGAGRQASSRAIGRRALLAGGLAASAAAIGAVVVRPPLDLWPSWSDLTADYHTQAGERRTVTLAESVSVEMNTRTSIGLRSKPQGARPPGSRPQGSSFELISGEAAISASCSDDQPVVVTAGGGQIRSSRAKFDIRHDAGTAGGTVRVTCLDGSVEVERAATRVTLQASQQLSYSDVGIGPTSVIDPAMVTAWQQGLLIFRDEPLSQMLDEVNRYWSGRIILLNADLGRRHVTARIELARIGEAISYVHTVLGAQVRTLPGGVVLLS